MKTKEIYMYVLGALIVIGFYLVLIIVFKLSIPDSNKDLALLVIGALIAKFSDVVGYFYGSSKGSSDKNEMLNKNSNV